MLVDTLRVWLSHLRQPATDLGVAVQLVLFLALLGGSLWGVRHRPEWRLVVVGIGLCGLALFGLRAAH